MVDALLALLPPLVGGGLYLLGCLASREWGSEVSISAAAHVILVALAVAATAFAALRRRKSGVLFSAWLLLLIGILLFSAGEILELLTRSGDNVIEEVFRVAAFVPFAAFALQIASPLTIVFASRRRFVGLIVIAVALFAAITLVEVLPVLAGAAAEHPLRGLHSTLAMVRPFLDILLFLPIAAVVAFVGLRRRGESYVSIGLGILAMLPGDVLFHYDLLTGKPGLEEAAFAFTAVSLMYFAIGSLRSAIQGESPRPEAPASA
jgi:hypothetical protein